MKSFSEFIEFHEERSDDFFCFHCNKTFETPDKLNTHLAAISGKMKELKLKELLNKKK